MSLFSKQRVEPSLAQINERSARIFLPRRKATPREPLPHGAFGAVKSSLQPRRAIGRKGPTLR